MTAHYIFKTEGAKDNSRGAVFTLDLLTQATCQQFCTSQELEVKAGRAENRGEEKAEGQESPEGCGVDGAEGDAPLAMRSEESSLDAPLTLGRGVKSRTGWSQSIGTHSVNSERALRSLCPRSFGTPASSLAAEGLYGLQHRFPATSDTELGPSGPQCPYLKRDKSPMSHVSVGLECRSDHWSLSQLAEAQQWALVQPNEH